MEVGVKDVVRLVLQMLSEMGLEKSYTALEEESGISLNVVSSRKDLKTKIKLGEWRDVLKLLEKCELPHDICWSLYEEIAQDLVRDDIPGNVLLAKQLLRESPELKSLQTENGQRFDNLQDTVYNKFKRTSRSDEEVAQSRKGLADKVVSCVSECGTSRLLELLGNALAWRKERGEAKLIDPDGTCHLLGKTSSVYNNTHSSSSSISNSGPTAKRAKSCGVICNVQYAKVKLGSASVAHQVAYMNGSALDSLATGTVDGFIEIWNAKTGKLRMDLQYQANENIMMHKGAVLGLGFSTDNKLLVSGSMDGAIKVWKVSKGKCETRIKRAHLGKPVNCVNFSKATDKIVSGGNDNSARIFGVLSGQMLVELRGHTSQVNSVCFILDDTQIVSSSNDHTVKTWNSRTGEALQSVELEAPVNNVLPYRVDSKDALAFLACPRVGHLAMISFELGKVNVHKMKCPNGQTRFICAACVPGKSKQVIYAAAEDGKVYGFKNAKDTTPEAFSGGGDLLGLTLQSSNSSLACFTSKGKVFLFGQ